MNGTDKVKWVKGWYTRGDLMEMDPVPLRALFRERTHHTIECEIYPILLGTKEVPSGFGLQPQLILDVWKERGFSDNAPDFEWGKRYLSLAEKLRAGEKVEIDEPLPEPFTDDEMKVVEKLIYQRRSVRDWVTGKKVTDDMIDKILEAGRAAPCGCNLDIIRFIVIRDPEEAKMVWSDVPTPMDRCVLIVICYDTRIYETVGHAHSAPVNWLDASGPFDCAVAADHMCLMAHALGLGAVWLTKRDKTARVFKEKYGLPEYIEPALHLAIGWAAMGTIKTLRMPIQDMMIRKDA